MTGVLIATFMSGFGVGGAYVLCVVQHQERLSHGRCAKCGRPLMDRHGSKRALSITRDLSPTMTQTRTYHHPECTPCLDPVECDCDSPAPDGIGECAGCRRRVMPDRR